MTTPRLDVWDRWADPCLDCGGRRTGWTGEAVRGAGRLALVWVFLYAHESEPPEVFVDAALGGWGDPAAPERVTFGSRTGAVEGVRGPASSLVTGAAVAPDDPVLGHRLDRDDALAHPLLTDFWLVSDLALEHVARSGELAPPGPPPRRWWPRRGGRLLGGE